MQNLWWCIPDGVEEDFVNKIIKHGCEKELVKGTVGSNEGNIESEVRKTDISFLDPKKSKDIFDLIWDLAVQVNKSSFGFDITSVENVQYTVYDSSEKAKYDWHIDTFWCNPNSPLYHRKISVVIQLSDPSEYEGGDFEIDHLEWSDFVDDSKQKGSVVVFPSFLSHRVTPVTKGVRRSLVAWIDGANFR